jgi:predicted dehydrogenase
VFVVTRDVQQLRVGVVGAGPWSTMIHAPMFANHPRTTLAGVWGRRIEAAEEVASPYGAPAFSSFEALLDSCEAVSFAVPPDVQAEMAMTAARAGKALLLEKPLALDLAHATQLVNVISETGVPNQLDLTWRYADVVRSFLLEVEAAERIGGRAEFITGAYLGGTFATPWRLEHGPLLDVGPHLIDLLEAALGPVVGIRAHGDLHRWIGLFLEHDTGLASEVSISAYAPIRATGSDLVAPIRAGAEVYTSGGAVAVDTSDVFNETTTNRIIDEFIETVGHRSSHVLDAHHGLHLQRLLESAISDVT